MAKAWRWRNQWRKRNGGNGCGRQRLIISVMKSAAKAVLIKQRKCMKISWRNNGGISMAKI
jgi:hypothetical protein